MQKINNNNKLKRLINEASEFNIDIEDDIKELKKNPLLKGFDINITNYNMFLLYLEAHANCKDCKGLKECKNTTLYHGLRVEGEAEYHLVSFPCRYYQEAQRLNSMQSKFNALYVPQGILKANIDELYLTNDSRQKALNYVISFAGSYPDVKKGLYIYGNFQTGKTYFLAATANYLASKGIESLLIYFPDLVRELKGSMFSDREKYESKINLLKSVPVLMLDDLGAEVASEWLRDEVLGPVLNYRLQEGLPLFISSNLSLSELKDHYKSIDDNETNAVRIFERIKGLTVYHTYLGK